MKFESEKKETIMLNPMKNLERKVIPSEIRKDPLTGRTARICHFMKLKWEKPDFEKMIAGTHQYCPFCPDKIMKVTPLFPPEINSDGRFTADDMVLFPNLAPYDSISAVAVMGSKHYTAMTEFEAERIAAAFILAMKLFTTLEEIGHPESVYHLINWNYMPPSGSSLIHPHLQIFSAASAPNLMRTELEFAKAYMEKNSRNYWDDLVKTEREKGERYLGTIGRTVWLSNFAPMGVAGDVLAVVEGVRSTLELSETDLLDIASGLTKVMAAYDKMGIYSFNMNFFTGTADDDFSRFHLLFSPRTFFNQALGTPDVGAGQKLYNETVCMAYPEEINEMLKPEFH